MFKLSRAALLRRQGNKGLPKIYILHFGVLERSFGWLEKCRRLWKNCERKLNTSLQFVHLAFLALLLRRL